jgi:hypothetical protein
MKYKEILKESLSRNNTTKVSVDVLVEIVESHQANEWEAMSGEEYLKRLQEGTLSWQAK